MSVMQNSEHLLPAAELLLGSTRFDLVPKLLYIKYGLAPTEPLCFAPELYLAHIRAFNGFREAEPRKLGPDDFLNAFSELFESVRNDGFDSRCRIPLTPDRNPQNGAHRVATAHFFGLKVPTTVVQRDYARHWTYAWFLKRGLDRNWADFIALERVRLSSDARAVLVHGAVASDLDGEIHETLHRFGAVFYASEFHLDADEYEHLVRESYSGQEWLEDPINGQDRARKYVSKAYGSGLVRAYVLIGMDDDAAIAAKAAVRELVGRRHHAIHIPDSHEQNIQLASALFSPTTRELFADFRPPQGSALIDQLQQLDDALAAVGVSRSEVCVTGSSVMDALGIRKGRDLDVLHSGRKCDALEQNGIGCHCSESGWYGSSPLEIVNDPRKHFYFRGFKFAHPEVVRMMKSARRERPKDVRDVRLLRTWRARSRLRNARRTVRRAFGNTF